MDEPLSNLDAKLRVQMRAEIAGLQRDLGVTTIYVTHDQVEAMTMGDRVAVIKKGLLQQVDSPQSLYDHPNNLFVAGFIGSPAMNMFEATLSSSDGKVFAEFAEVNLELDKEVLDSRPKIRDYVGRQVVLGIRPEDFEDAQHVADASENRRIRATVDLREALGSEILIHFTMNTPIVLTEDTKELAVDVGAEAVADLEERAKEAKTSVVAQLSPRTGAAEGKPIDLAVDTGRLHFFDVESGLGIYG
jgi:multiple sugar transport system ATP-binding protein